MLSLLPTTVSKCWTKFAQYFEFWYEFAQTSETAVRYMFRKEFIKHFLDYFLDKKSPLQIYANKPHTIGSKYANPNFNMLLKTVTHLIEKCLLLKDKKLLSNDDYQLLLHFDCLEKLIQDNYESVCAALVKEICRDNLFASERVTIVLMKGLCKSTFDNVQPYLDVLHEFMLVDDIYQDLRIKWIIGKQTLALNPISKNIVSLNSYSMEERIYNFDSTYYLEQASPLLDPIYQYHRKV